MIYDCKATKIFIIDQGINPVIKNSSKFLRYFDIVKKIHYLCNRVKHSGCSTVG